MSDPQSIRPLTRTRKLFPENTPDPSKAEPPSTSSQDSRQWQVVSQLEVGMGGSGFHKGDFGVGTGVRLQLGFDIPLLQKFSSQFSLGTMWSHDQPAPSTTPFLIPPSPLDTHAVYFNIRMGIPLRNDSIRLNLGLDLGTAAIDFFPGQTVSDGLPPQIYETRIWSAAELGYSVFDGILNGGVRLVFMPGSTDLADSIEMIKFYVGLDFFALGRKIIPSSNPVNPAPDNRTQKTWAENERQRDEFAKLSIPQLIEKLKDPDRETRLAAIFAIADFGTSAKIAIPSLIDLLGVELHGKADIKIVMAVDIALVDMGQDAAVPALMEAFHSEKFNRAMKEHVLYIFRRMGNAATLAIPLLAQVLQGDDEISADLAVQALESIGTNSIPVLVEALQKARPFGQAYAAECLGRFRAAEAVPTLIETLESPVRHVRLCAILALARIGRSSVGAISILQQLVREDPAEDVRKVAQEALRIIIESSSETPPLES